jgi:undecaprenyl-diphosphatase
VTYPQALVLGIVQGVTEFLPVSSSGHLILVPHVFGWADQGLAFDAALHLGTLAALIAYFRAELLGFVTGALSRRLALILIVATVPGALIGAGFGRAIEEHLRWPLLIAATTAFYAVVMWMADRTAARATPAGSPMEDRLETVSWGRGLVIGCAQALALVPGTSRSGITITAGLFSGLDRATAARFAFLLGIPITAGAGLKKTYDLLKVGLPPGEGTALAIGVLASFVSGWIAVWFLVSYLKRRSLLPFVIYRLILAAAIVLVGW